MKEQQKAEFNAMADNMIKWLNDNGHPHMKIIIDSDSAEIVEGVVGYTTKQHVKG